jgi:uncharacterized protein involved in exopolysaccharide biosynthesis
VHLSQVELRSEDTVDLRASLARLWVRRWWIAASIVLCAAAFAAVAFVVTPVYQAASVLISVNSDRSMGGVPALGQLGGLTSLIGVNVGVSDEKTTEALAVLRSRQFTQSFIDEEGLMAKLFARDWDAARSAWKKGLRHPPTPAMAYKYFDRKIRVVAQDKKTGLVTLTVYWRDRTEAANWANEMVRRLNAEMRARAIAQANDNIAYLEKELLVTTVVETRQAINRLIDAQVKQRMMANVTQDYAFRAIDKAIAPDIDDPVWPNRHLLLVLGPVIGLLAGVFLALVWDRLTGHVAR